MSLASKLSSLLDSAGNLLSARLPATFAADVAANAATVVAGASMPGGFKGLKITNGATPDSQITVTADALLMANASGTLKVFPAVNVTASTGSNGANGLDTGSIASSTWYAIWVIGKADGTVAALLSLSATAPTLPSGYTFSARYGWARYVTSSLARFTQYGRLVRYKVTAGSATTVLPALSQGTAGTYSATSPSYASISVSSAVPSTASCITLAVSDTLSGTLSAIGIAPSTSYSGLQTTGFPLFGENTASAVCATVEFMLEGTSIGVYSSTAGGLVACYGWEDNI